MGDGERVAVGVLEVGDLGVALEVGYPPPVRLEPRLVVALEDHAPLRELRDYPLDAPTGQGRRGLAGVLRGEVDAEQAVFGAAVLQKPGESMAALRPSLPS